MDRGRDADGSRDPKIGVRGALEMSSKSGGGDRIVCGRESRKDYLPLYRTVPLWRHNDDVGGLISGLSTH